MAKTWKVVRKEAVALGAIDEARVDELKRAALHHIRADRLAEERREQELNQVEVGSSLEVSVRPGDDQLLLD